MNVAVIGGRGFVGESVTHHLTTNHAVTTIDPRSGGAQHYTADVTDPKQITAAVEGCDAVVNLAGLTPIHDPGGTSYEAVHVDGARNVVQACQQHGIEQLAHMSALGADPAAEMEALRTKGIGEQLVLDSGLDVTVFRPSIIFDGGNEFVELARTWAWTRVFPHIRTRVQPVYRGDVAQLFTLAVDGGIEDAVVEVGGPDQMTLFQLAEQLYNAEGYACHALPVSSIMRAGLYVLEYVPFIPFGRDQVRYLSFDNTTQQNDAATYVDLTSVDAWLARTS